MTVKMDKLTAMAAQDSSATYNDNNNNPALREALISTAVKFLQNPKVYSSPLAQKEQFLKSKGLSDEEIKKAFELSSLSMPPELPIGNATLTLPPNHVYSPHLAQLPLFYKLKEFFNVTAFIGTTLYCVYWFYKRFIEPLLFGRPKKRPSITADSEVLKDSVKEMKDSLTKLEDGVNKLVCNHSPDPTVPHLVQELKQDLASLKGLLLSRKQFPSAPPSIPSWQLEAPSQIREKTVEREDDAASGSSTNNSDSSLEMIREEPHKIDINS